MAILDLGRRPNSQKVQATPLERVFCDYLNNKITVQDYLAKYPTKKVENDE